MDRRHFLSLSLRTALAGSLLRDGLARAESPQTDAVAAPAELPRACIVLWMNGGPSHLDTWDLKPGTREGGPFQAIDTRVPGLRISEHLPRLADAADRLVVLRGLASREGNHDRARHLLHTGYAPSPTVAHPGFGAWTAEELGRLGDLPAHVAINGPGSGGGFLGVQFDPFVVRKADQPPQNTALPRGFESARFDRRLAALSMLEKGFAASMPDPKVNGHRLVQDAAVRLMRSPELAAFELTAEAAQTRAAYGENDFGRGCLLARRLVERGVRYVEVVLDGWDTHDDNFTRVKKLSQTFDPAFRALLDDLRDRGMAEQVLVAWMGDFGRTPKINGRDGRDHHPGASTVVLAGGGLKTGQLLGATDATGTKVVSGAVRIPDLFATMARSLRIDPDVTRVSPLGRPLSVTDEGKPLGALFA